MFLSIILPKFVNFHRIRGGGIIPPERAQGGNTSFTPPPSIQLVTEIQTDRPTEKKRQTDRSTDMGEHRISSGGGDLFLRDPDISFQKHENLSYEKVLCHLFSFRKLGFIRTLYIKHLLGEGAMFSSPSRTCIMLFNEDILGFQGQVETHLEHLT